MLTYSQAFYDLKGSLQPLYDEGEAVAIAHAILEHITGSDKLQRITDKDKKLTIAQGQQFQSIKEKLQKATPLQYILGKAWFLGREFAVNENVLIPRPETEELVTWVINDCKDNNTTKASIIDIGTGSGCIPVSLKLELPDATVACCDVSAGALLVAKANADILDATISFHLMDFTDYAQHDALGKYDIIVSNPPYIPDSEQDTLHANVRDHEPHLALFVPGNDALLFYRLIADFGITHLHENGFVYCELDRDYALQARDLFTAKGYSDVEIKVDMAGNTRMLKAVYKK